MYVVPGNPILQERTSGIANPTRPHESVRSTGFYLELAKFVYLPGTMIVARHM